jgi:hypothetical protein
MSFDPRLIVECIGLRLSLIRPLRPNSMLNEGIHGDWLIPGTDQRLSDGSQARRDEVRSGDGSSISPPPAAGLLSASVGPQRRRRLGQPPKEYRRAQQHVGSELRVLNDAGDPFALAENFLRQEQRHVPVFGRRQAKKFNRFRLGRCLIGQPDVNQSSLGLVSDSVSGEFSNAGKANLVRSGQAEAGVCCVDFLGESGRRFRRRRGRRGIEAG